MKHWRGSGGVIVALFVCSLLLLSCKGAGDQAAKRAAPESAEAPAQAVAPAPEPEPEPAVVTPPAVEVAEATEEEAAPEVERPVPADLPPVQARQFEYPPFKGKPIAVIHTENVIGELAPCG